ncbi:hypothetical protein HDU81_009004 [Chytriomyces hyalinus]|nr:hypothetical protein HDU81_009004 [Chytriomyces hyalinus]
MGRLQALPPELLQSIAEHLPINATLGRVGALCRSMRNVTAGCAFAVRHVRRHMQQTEMDLADVWDLCEADTLPDAYAAALLAWMVAAGAFEVTQDLLVAATPPGFGEDAAMRVLKCFETMPALYKLPLSHPALLNLAAYHGYTRMTIHLLSHMQDASDLHLPTMNSATETSNLCFATGNDSNNDEPCPDSLNTRMMALKWASENGHVDVLEQLLDNTSMDPRWNESLVLASSACEGHESCVRLLLRDGRAQPTNYALNRAAENGHAEVVRLLLKDPRLRLHATDNAPLKWSCENGHVPVVQLLLHDGRIHPGNRNNFNIKRAAREGHAEVVALLLADARVDPTAEDQYAIKWSARNGHVEVVRLLLGDARIDKHAENNCALEWAIEYSHAEVMALLA